MTLRPGERWGTPATGAAELVVRGSDADLARAALAAARAPGPAPLVEFRPAPDSDLARALGGPPVGSTDRAALPIDLVTIDLEPPGRATVHSAVVNMAVVGTPPDRIGYRSRWFSTSVLLDGRPVFEGRAASVVVANGEFLRGVEVVPRGHPGDGRIELQVYAPARRERRAMRGRLPTGTHLPHPRIIQRAGRVVELTVTGVPVPVELDGRPGPGARALRAGVVAGGLRLLV